MKHMLAACCLIVGLNWQLNAQSVQEMDTLHYLQERRFAHRFRSGKSHPFFCQPILPSSLFISYGIISLRSEQLKQLNVSTKLEISEHHTRPFRLDNYTQYLPTLLVYGLNAAGIKGQHNVTDRSLIYITSQILSAAMVVPLKHLVREERPDKSNLLSFPSGHTATAFSSAQFMFREYQQQNFLLSISGYAAALYTGIYRTFNNRHWLGDVMGGAGIGILATEAAYSLYPMTSRLIGHKKTASNRILVPNFADGAAGIIFVQHF